jgi:hypothetical protein
MTKKYTASPTYTNSPLPAPSGHFVEENASKPLCTESYNNSMSLVDLSIQWQMATAFSVR